MLSYVTSGVTNVADLAWCPGTKDVLGTLRPCNLMIRLTPTRLAVQRSKDRTGWCRRPLERMIERV
jgi:hypothetical protein